MNLLSQRSMQIALTKLDKRYDAAIAARNMVGHRARETGWDDEMFAEQKTHPDEMAKVLGEMEALQTLARKHGHYINCNWLRYFGSTHAQLVAENRD